MHIAMLCYALLNDMECASEAHLTNQDFSTVQEKNLPAAPQ